jgi:leader peptidase (prepilin peptidase) / N-methyltransferase
MIEEPRVRAIPDVSNPLLLIPAGLLLALIAIALLPGAVAADTAARVFVLIYVLLSAIDVFTKKVPNVVIYPSIVFALAATAIIDSSLMREALIGGAAMLGLMFLLAVIGGGRMGMGDVKVACLSGCVLGLRGGFFSLCFGFAIGAAVALPILLLRIRSRKDSVPLTPFLAVGAMIWVYLNGFLLGGRLL